MPTYEYRCDACSHEMEEFQSMSAKPLKKCPQCGKSKLKRLIGIGAGVIFKGSGFYETDYRSKGYSDAAKAEKESATKTETATTTTDSSKSDGTKSEAAPAPAAAKSEAPTKPESKPKAQKKAK